jgi:hypothetical protein
MARTEYTRKSETSWIRGIVAILFAAVAIFAVYSYVTSRNMDRAATTAGSSTDPKASNTLQDRGWGPSGGPSPTTGSNVPPADRNVPGSTTGPGRSSLVD